MADQNSPDPLTPSLPPIPASSLQDSPPTPLDSPSQVASASLSSSIDNDMPISEVVAALKNTPQSPTPILTEVKTEGIPPTPAPTPTTPVAPAAPVVPAPSTPTPPTPAAPASPPATKSPLYEDPDQIKVPGAV